MWNKQMYQDTFSKVTASQTLYKEVMNMSGKYQSQQKPRRTGQVTRNLLIAAVIAATLVVSVGAYAAFRRYQNAAPVMEAAFGENGHAHVDSITITEDKGEYGISKWQTPESDRIPLNKELADTLVAPYLCAVEETYTYGDYTLNVDAYTYDEQTRAGLIYYSLENPNGFHGKEYEPSPTGEVYVPIDFGLIRVRSYVIPELTTSTKMALIGYFYHFYHEPDPNKPEPQKELYVKLDIRKIPGPAAPEGWFDVHNHDEPMVWSGPELQDYPGAVLPLLGFGGSMEPFSHVSCKEDAIVISPFSLRTKHSFEEEAYGDQCYTQEVRILFQDGTEYLVLNENTANYTVHAGDGDRSPTSGTTLIFNRIINPSQVRAIVLNGTEYPVA